MSYVLLLVHITPKLLVHSGQHMKTIYVRSHVTFLLYLHMEQNLPNIFGFGFFDN